MRKQSRIRRIWRVLYPCGIHFLISQIIGYAGIWLAMQLLGEGGTEAYYNNAILLTGLTGLITMIPCLYFYKKDRRARIAGGLVTGQKPNRLSIGECGLILVMGAGFAQFANMFVNMIGSFLNAEEYQETMSQLADGKSMFFLIVCMGIIAPLAEEIVFRWLIYLRLRDYMRSGEAIVISGLFFGIYHGNLVQGVYASILGCFFAYFLEQTGSLWTSVLLHMGANIWSLVLPELAAWLLDRYPMGIAVMLVLLLTGMCAGISYFRNRTDTEQRRII